MSHLRLAVAAAESRCLEDVGGIRDESLLEGLTSDLRCFVVSEIDLLHKPEGVRQYLCEMLLQRIYGCNLNALLEYGVCSVMSRLGI